jgi:tetratricopeptide (TPR) repeat protein
MPILPSVRALARLLAVLLVALLAVRPDRAQDSGSADPTADFGLDDVERLVAEVMSAAPEYPLYVYPIVCEYLTGTSPDGRTDYDTDVNAFSFVDDELRARICFQKGMTAACGGDERRVRAVLAHEIAHLACGHSAERHDARRDLVGIYSRQQEREADLHGALYLEKLGHARKDMVDVMFVLQATLLAADSNGALSWLGAVGSDHASPMMRAAVLAPDEKLLKAASLFEIGVAYMECRRYGQALAFFDQATTTDWMCVEADQNAASAALQEYYDRLPAAVHEEWLRPEFGPHLTNVAYLRGRAIEITAEDLARYAEALRRIEAMLINDSMSSFLSGTAKVLHPQGDEATLRAGIAELRALLARNRVSDGWEKTDTRLLTVNNIAVGLARLGEDEQAARELRAAMLAGSRYVVGVGENLARLPLKGLGEQEAVAVLELLYRVLQWSPADAPAARQAARAADKLLADLGRSFTTPPVPSKLPLCPAISMTIDGHELGLFDPLAKVSLALGELGVTRLAEERFPGLEILDWAGGQVVALGEDGRIVKLTSYRPGTTLELRPTRDSGLRESYFVRVGMSEADFQALLAPAGGDEAQRMRSLQLVSRISLEAPAVLKPDATEAQETLRALTSLLDEWWSYYPFLNFGVLIEDGVVSGISVTPVSFYPGELDPQPGESAAPR